MHSAPPLLARALYWLLGVRRQGIESDPCTINLDGKPVRALEGQCVAAVLVRTGTWDFQRNPVSGEARGPYCGMGVCFECEVVIDGAPARRACLTDVRDGMVIHTAASAERVPA